MSQFTDAAERANKTALLLARERYAIQYQPFVKSASRLSYLESRINRLLDEVCDEVEADRDWVADRFLAYVKETVEYKQNPDGIPSGQNETDTDTSLLPGIHKTDVMDHGEVPGAGREEATNDGIERQDLSKDSCFRCGDTLGQVTAKHTSVCLKCTSELKRLSEDYVNGDSTSTGPWDAQQEPVNHNIELPYRCKACGFEGNENELMDHVQRDHNDILQRGDEMGQFQQPQDQYGEQAQNPQFPEPAFSAVKEADLPDEDQDAAKVQPLPSSPADQFDSMVQQLADRAAAEQFSAPDEEQIHSIASQLGLSPDDVKTNLITVATFGNYSGRNGQLSDDTQIPEGYEEVSANTTTSSAQQTALVPTQSVINKVAEDLAMDPQLAYDQVRDRYGDELPDKYHAPVTGEMHYYLPTELAGNQQGAQQAVQEQQQMQQQPQQPAAPPAPEAVAPAQTY